MRSFSLLAAVIVSGAVTAVLVFVGAISLGMANQCKTGVEPECDGLGETVGLVMGVSGMVLMYVTYWLWQAYKKSR